MEGFKQGCFYCEHSDVQKERMIEITKLSKSTVFLNRDQTHFGRVIVALNWHADELFDLSDSERQIFINEVSSVAKIISEITNCNKMNYAIYGDTVSHLHFHLVPKKITDVDWNDPFINTPKNIEKISLADGNKNNEYEALIEKIRKELSK